MKKFKYEWDWLNIMITVITVVVLSTTLYVSYFHHLKFVFWIMLAICVPLFVTPFFCCPLSVEKDGNDLWINFLLRRKHIDLSDCKVEQVRRVGSFEYMRTLGAWTYFGYWGYFSKEGQSYLFFLTHGRENVCMISSESNPRKLMINAPYEWFAGNSKGNKEV